MIFCLCFFSCYNMVAKFYYQDYVSYAHVLSTLASALNALPRWLWWCMSPQKLLFCYHLPTRGRAGVKLGDAWYISNVSIIFDAPCLFIHHLLCVLLHFVAFYAFSRTNLLTRCHSASSLFLLFLYFRKAKQEIFSELEETKAEPPIFPDTRQSPKMRRRGAGPGHTLGQRGLALAHATLGWGHMVHLLTPPFRLYIPLDGKNLSPNQFSMKPTASRRRRRREIGRVQKLFPAPCRRGQSPLEAFFITMVASGVMCE
jgi:hypothetical protein